MNSGWMNLRRWCEIITGLRLKRNNLLDKHKRVSSSMFYTGVVYGGIGGSSNPYESKIEKGFILLSEIEEKIKQIDKQLKVYDDFKSQLTSQLSKTFEMYFEDGFRAPDVSIELRISVRRVYYYVKKLENMYKDGHQ